MSSADDHLGKWLGWVEPVPSHTDIDVAPRISLHAKPVNEAFGSFGCKRFKHAAPSQDDVRAPVLQRTHHRLYALTRRGLERIRFIVEPGE